MKGRGRVLVEEVGGGDRGCTDPEGVGGRHDPRRLHLLKGGYRSREAARQWWRNGREADGRRWERSEGPAVKALCWSGPAVKAQCWKDQL